MTIIRSSQLTGIALDWAVAKCEGVTDTAFQTYYEPSRSADYDRHGFPEYHFSTIWFQGGPISEREGISSQKKHDGLWLACMYDLNDDPHHYSISHSRLEAEMRCYVTSRFGKQVEVPKYLYRSVEFRSWVKAGFDAIKPTSSQPHVLFSRTMPLMHF